jgi:hypothetical protein
LPWPARPAWGSDFLLLPTSTSTCTLDMATPLAVDVVTVATAATGVALAALVAAITTLQVAAAASHERAVGAASAAGALAGTTAGAASPWATTAVTGAPTGTVVGAPTSTAACATGTRPRRHCPRLPQLSLAPGPLQPSLEPPQTPALVLPLGRPSTRRRCPVLVDVACLLCGTPIWLAGATGGTLVHATSAIAIVVVWVVGHTVPRRLPQLDGGCSPHARNRLGGRLRRHQPYHTPPRSHLVTEASFACPPVLHRC